MSLRLFNRKNGDFIQNKGYKRLDQRRWTIYSSLESYWKINLKVESLHEDYELDSSVHPDCLESIKIIIEESQSNNRSSNYQIFIYDTESKKEVFRPVNIQSDKIQVFQTANLRYLTERSWIESLDSNLENDLKRYDANNSDDISPIHVSKDDSKIRIGKDVSIEPNVFFDISKGPIVIDSDTIVRANTVLRGPLFIGSTCRIAGEVSHCYIEDYTNKNHYGFIGHSWIGCWTNWGAGSGASNLRLDYGPQNKEQFCGAVVGDGAKISCNTIMQPGTRCYPYAQVIGYSFPPRVVASRTRIHPNNTNYKSKRIDDNQILMTEKTMHLRRNKNVDKIYL